jgi:hypothetical protein
VREREREEEEEEDHSLLFVWSEFQHRIHPELNNSIEVCAKLLLSFWLFFQSSTKI